MQALGLLYQHTGEYDKALKIYLHGGAIIGTPLANNSAAPSFGASNYVFDIIQKRNLYSNMVGEVEHLINFDKYVFVSLVPSSDWS